jgi:DnaJ family protein A protein 2
LVEALGGFQILIEHLDGKQMLIKSKPGEIIKPGDVRVIPNAGMPTYKRQYEKGSLYVSFKVKFPKPESISVRVHLSDCKPTKNFFFL